MSRPIEVSAVGTVPTVVFRNVTTDAVCVWVFRTALEAADAIAALSQLPHIELIVATDATVKGDS